MLGNRGHPHHGNRFMSNTFDELVNFHQVPNSAAYPRRKIQNTIGKRKFSQPQKPTIHNPNPSENSLILQHQNNSFRKQTRIMLDSSVDNSGKLQLTRKNSLSESRPVIKTMDIDQTPSPEVRRRGNKSQANLGGVTVDLGLMEILSKYFQALKDGKHETGFFDENFGIDQLRDITKRGAEEKDKFFKLFDMVDNFLDMARKSLRSKEKGLLMSISMKEGQAQRRLHTEPVTEGEYGEIYQDNLADFYGSQNGERKPHGRRKHRDPRLGRNSKKFSSKKVFPRVRNQTFGLNQDFNEDYGGHDKDFPKTNICEQHESKAGSDQIFDSNIHFNDTVQDTVQDMTVECLNTLEVILESPEKVRPRDPSQPLGKQFSLALA
jgi:hypothetical protein